MFGFTSDGFDSPGQPGTSVGQYNFDGNGNVSGAFTHSNGTISSVTFTGTYSVAKNCTGSLVVNNSKGVTEHHNFVIDNGKKGMQLIRTDAGQVKHGFAVAQGAGTCGLTGKKQTYAFNLSGIDNGVGGPVAYVGQLTFDGKGNIPFGNITLNLNGTIFTSTITGTYTVNSNCTGAEQITISGAGTANQNFVLVNGRKEALLIETDSNTIVSGNAQQ